MTISFFYLKSKIKYIKNRWNAFFLIFNVSLYMLINKRNSGIFNEIMKKLILRKWLTNSCLVVRS
jgi:hypothetical protein